MATGLLQDANGRIAGVRTDRADGDTRARIVIACDGVNSFLAKEAGSAAHSRRTRPWASRDPRAAARGD